MDFYQFFHLFANFFGIFYYASSGNETELQFLFSPFLGLFQPILAWNEAITVFFDFLIFFFSFFGIFYYLSGKNGTERQFLFFLFLGLFQPILAWNEAIMEFFIFLNFFAIFLEFSITLWVGTKRNDNFYFLSSLAFSNLFWLEMTP